MRIFQFLNLLTQDERNSKVVFLKAKSEANRDQIAGRAAVSDDLPDGIPIKYRTRFRELTGRDSD